MDLNKDKAMLESVLEEFKKSGIVDAINNIIRSNERFFGKTPSGMLLSDVQISVNYAVDTKNQIPECRPWFSIEIGCIDAQHVSLKVFPDNNITYCDWWKNGKLIKSRTIQ